MIYEYINMIKDCNFKEEINDDDESLFVIHKE